MLACRYWLISTKEQLTAELFGSKPKDTYWKFVLPDDVKRLYRKKLSLALDCIFTRPSSVVVNVLVAYSESEISATYKEVLRWLYSGRSYFANYPDMDGHIVLHLCLQPLHRHGTMRPAKPVTVREEAHLIICRSGVKTKDGYSKTSEKQTRSANQRWWSQRSN